jgi:hypothetical protein
MNLLFVSMAPPDLEHVSAKRVPSFARALAKRGHRVVVITRPSPATHPLDDPEDLVALLTRQDWRAPLFVSASLQPPLTLRVQRTFARVPVVRPALTMVHFAAHQGMYTDWSGPIRRALPGLLSRFRPDVVWGTHHPTDSWLIAREAAAIAGCPLALDIKDPWDSFVPKGFRRSLSTRFRNAAALTANSAHQLERARAYFPMPGAVVYSGFDAELLAIPPITPAPLGGPPVVALVGGLKPQGDGSLSAFLDGFNRWADAFPEGARPELVYAGSSAARVRDAILRAGPLRTKVRVEEQLPYTEYTTLCARASVLAYISSERVGIHHRTTELPLFGKPMIAYPGDSEEAVGLVGSLGGVLATPGSPEELASALAEAISFSAEDRPGRDPNALDAGTWDARAVELEAVLSRVAAC